MWLSMCDADRNKHHICIHDNLFNFERPHQRIHLKGKETSIQCTNSKMVFVKRNFHLNFFHSNQSFELMEY